MATKTNTKINGRDYFRIRRTIDGKQKPFYGKSKGDAEKQYKAYLEERARLKYKEEQIQSTATIQERAEEYIRHALWVSQRYATGTKERYEQAYTSHVKDTDFAGKVASQIKARDVQRFYNGLDVSQQTLKAIHKFMSAFFKWMTLNEYAPSVLSAVELPVKKDNSRSDGIVVWSDDEVRTILKSMNGPTRLSDRHRLAFMVSLMIYSGMRIGEVIALKYADIRDNTIHVERQLYLGEEKPPKWNSNREIPMHPALVSAFEDHLNWHKYDMEKNKYQTEYVFTTSTGRLYDQANIRRALSRFYSKIGVEDKHPHVYRATFCTNLCRYGAPLEVASKLMGHKSLEVTAKHYALIRPESKLDSISLLPDFNK